MALNMRGHAGVVAFGGKCFSGGETKMSLIANALVALVAVLHLYFLVLEMFLWTKPRD